VGRDCNEGRVPHNQDCGKVRVMVWFDQDVMRWNGTLPMIRSFQSCNASYITRLGEGVRIRTLLEVIPCRNRKLSKYSKQVLLS